MATSKVGTTMSQLKAKTAKHILEENGIPVFLMDKTDSEFPQMFGRIEIYVATEQAEEALRILDDQDILEEEE